MANTTSHNPLSRRDNRSINAFIEITFSRRGSFLVKCTCMAREIQKGISLKLNRMSKRIRKVSPISSYRWTLQKGIPRVCLDSSFVLKRLARTLFALILDLECLRSRGNWKLGVSFYVENWIRTTNVFMYVIFVLDECCNFLLHLRNDFEKLDAIVVIIFGRHLSEAAFLICPA